MTGLTLEQHAERANAIVWADADTPAQDAWCEEGLAAEAEGHSKSAVARAFGVARTTYKDRQLAYQTRRSGAGSTRRSTSVSKNLRYGMKHADPEEKAEIVAAAMLDDIAIANHPKVREAASQMFRATAPEKGDRPAHKTYKTPFDGVMQSATDFSATLVHFISEGHTLTDRQQAELRAEVATIIAKVNTIIVGDIDAEWLEVLNG